MQLEKKKHNFLFNYQQTGGAMNQQLLVNIFRRGLITYYSVNFQQHERFYDLYKEKIADLFFNSVKELFVSNRNTEFKMQWYAELKNYQQTELLELENTMV